MRKILISIAAFSLAALGLTVVGGAGVGIAAGADRANVVTVADGETPSGPPNICC